MTARPTLMTAAALETSIEGLRTLKRSRKLAFELRPVWREDAPHGGMYRTALAALAARDRLVARGIRAVVFVHLNEQRYHLSLRQRRLTPPDGSASWAVGADGRRRISRRMVWGRG